MSFANQPASPTQRGALIGLHSALKYAKAAVAACDLPFITPELFEHLAAVLTIETSEKVDALVPLQPDGKPQPLCAFYRRETCLPQIFKMLRSDNWSVRGLLGRLNTRQIDFTQLAHLKGASRFFINVNTAQDYRNYCTAYNLSNSQNSADKNEF